LALASFASKEKVTFDKKRSWPVSEKKKRTKVEETRKHTIFAIEDEEATS
jgi:hypothetical protein